MTVASILYPAFICRLVVSMRPSLLHSLSSRTAPRGLQRRSAEVGYHIPPSPLFPPTPHYHPTKRFLPISHHRLVANTIPLP